MGSEAASVPGLSTAVVAQRRALRVTERDHVVRAAARRLLSHNPQFQANPNLIYPGQRVFTGWTYPTYYT